ncbi:hypothetical protein ROA7450_00217 [Roseovarius albus]|uniref:DUF3592 domain-containing protein n=1 Tax=Roseovarius albus TaxID=1247867 RepID=A0A1X6Y974_9RHOB|nr:DUF3592 domain-containing protein [Roseovarius albus]SLN13752.1 hypothetical protein ROA7450_00217 [Roseovarius albus]
MSGQIAQKPPSVLALFLKMGGWFVLALGGLILLFSVVGQNNFKTAERFESEGLMAQAEVVKKYTSEHREPDGDIEITYRLVVQFTPTGSDVVTVDRSAPKSIYDNVEEGGRVKLFYLPNQPKKVELVRGASRAGATFLSRLSLVLGIVWLGALWVVGRWAVAGVRARRFGRREEALVSGVKQSLLTINGRPRFRLVWVDSQGREGVSLLHLWPEVEHYKAGDRVGIYHGIKWTWWVGDIGERTGM